MKKVMAMGTFDLLHPGHVYFLTNARKLGDSLTVLIARDETVKAVKVRNAVHPDTVRKANLAALGIADKVILGSTGKDKLAALIKEKPAIIALGYDQKIFTDKLKESLKARGLDAQVVRLRSYKPSIYKSSKLRESCELKRFGA